MNTNENLSHVDEVRDDRDRLQHLCDRIRAAYKQHQQADRKGVQYLSEIGSSAEFVGKK